MDYNKLKIFQHVAERKSVSAAAKALRRTQPAVSQQIALLEDELGFKLFQRRNGRIHISPQGEVLAKVLQDQFDGIDAVIHRLRDDLMEVSGTIQLGILLDHSTTFDLVSSVVDFSKEYPRVEFSMTFGSNSDIERLLRSQSIDLGFMILFQDPKAVLREEIAHAYHAMFCSQGNAKRLKRVSLEHILKEETLIDFSEDFMCMTPWIRKNFPSLQHALKVRRPSAIVPNHVESRKMVSQNWGTAILPNHLCEESQDQSNLVKLFPKTKDLRVGLDVAHLRSRTLRECERLFVHHVKTQTVQTQTLQNQ